MSSAPASIESAPPRVIVELGPNNQVIIESYINGQRQRVVANRGSEWWDIADTLFRIKSDRQRQAERQAEKKEKEVLSRHRRVWTGVAEDFGVHFANKTVGAKDSLTAPAAKNAAAAKGKKPVPTNAIPATSDLI